MATLIAAYAKGRSRLKSRALLIGISAVVAGGLAAPSPATAAGPHAGPVQASGTTFDVTTYGADPTGATDSTIAIRKAIAAAEATAGPNTVFFPAGTYTLNDPTDTSNFDLKLKGPNPIIVQGAGRDTTKIVEEVGLVKYPSLAVTKGVFEIEYNGGSGSTVTGVTVDSQTYQAGTTLLDYGSNTTIENDTFLGAKSTKTYNKDVFDVRVAKVCNHTDGLFNTGNIVSGLILNGQGLAGQVDLDISCQHNATISNITDTGNGVAFYIDSNVSLTTYTFSPGTTQSGPKSWQITGPSDHISLTGVTTSGTGGILTTTKNGYRITDTTITGETMTKPGFNLIIGDADNTVITGSTLDTIDIAPARSTNGVNVSTTTYTGVTCKSGATITGLVGITCP